MSSLPDGSRPRPRRVAAPDTTPAQWTVRELNAARRTLRGQAAELRAEIDEAERSYAELQRNGGEGSGDDQADAGTKTFEREHAFSLTQNRRDLLRQVERALDRLAAGIYGTCEVCGAPIGKARLQAFPSATLDVSCKALQERR